MKLWCWRRLLRVTWITRWSNQSIIKEINPEYWKEYCWSWSSSTLATWCEAWTHWKRPWWWESLKAKGKRSGRGWDSITDSTDMNLSKLQETEVDRGAWHATVHGVAKSQTYWLSDWKTTLLEIAFFFFLTCWYLKRQWTRWSYIIWRRLTLLLWVTQGPSVLWFSFKTFLRCCDLINNHLIP